MCAWWLTLEQHREAEVGHFLFISSSKSDVCASTETSQRFGTSLKALLCLPSSFDDVEYAEDYRPGDFHDVFAEDCYRVVHKLGSGGSSTISLASERSESRGFVRTIKVMRAKVSSNNSIKEVPELSVPLSVPPLVPHANTISWKLGLTDHTSVLSIESLGLSFYLCRLAREGLREVDVCGMNLPRRLCPWRFMAIFCARRELSS
jgi:hypothetical protein